MSMESGKLYFFTSTILNWQHLLSDDDCKQVVVDCWKHFIERSKLRIYSFVIMPNHYHLVWSVHDSKPETIQRDIHKWTAKQLISQMELNRPDRLEYFKVNDTDRVIQIWERNPLAVELYSEDVIWQKIEYIHNNPCVEKWHLAEYPEQYKYSSARFYLLNRDEWGFLTHIGNA